jgi:choline dehydrogenase-like flavoprotein
MLYDGGLTAPEAPGMAYGPVVIKPTSRGRVMLRSPMPLAKPRVVCNFLTTEEDRASMVAGLRMALEMAEQPALKAVIDQPFLVPQSDSEDDLLAFARREGMTVFHPTSSCSMGSVVDAELKVYGFDGLRVADASVMPEITRANTNAATIMIAEKAADLIRSGSTAAATAGVV